jgi:acrylyl-CoA reductase (NADPH)
VAIMLLAKAGWHVIASTGRPEEEAYLRGLGASEIIDRKELCSPGRPLGKERWIAGVDTVGSHTLANMLAQTKWGGAVAATGLAQGIDLNMTVAPFILRNVALLGVDSGGVSRERRLAGWARLKRDLDLAKLKTMTTTIPFVRLKEVANEILAGRTRGRVVVEIG